MVRGDKGTAKYFMVRRDKGTATDHKKPGIFMVRGIMEQPQAIRSQEY